MDNETAKRVNDLSWKLFNKTGEIKYYGAAKASQELMKGQTFEDEGYQPGE